MSYSGKDLICVLCVPAVVVLLSSCMSPEPAPEPLPTPDYSRPLEPGEKALVKIPRSEYPDLKKGFLQKEALGHALDESIDYMNKPSSRTHFPQEEITHERCLNSLIAFKEILSQSSSAVDFERRIQQQFEIYKSVGCDSKGTVLFTGYCEPVVRASLEKTECFKYPLYRLPDDLVKDSEGKTLGRRTQTGQLLPYYTREEIDGRGVLKGKGLELAWVEHPLDA
ncbi:MAG: MltA domain-containing protein, partial [Planctomycetota bacterium]